MKDIEESLLPKLLETIEPIYKQYVQDRYDSKTCKVFDRDLNDITPYSKKTEEKKNLNQNRQKKMRRSE